MYDPAISRWHVPDPIQEDEYDRAFEVALQEELGEDYNSESLNEGRTSNRDLTDLFSPVKLTPGNSAVHYDVSPYAYVLNNPINYKDWLGLDTLKEVVVTGKRIEQNSEGGDFVGPTMILLGQRLDFLKPVGALGSARGSSVASSVLSKALPQNIPALKKAEQKVVSVISKKAAKRAGTAVLGRFLGRLVPYVGWGMTIKDVYDYRNEIGEWMGDMKEYNEKNRYTDDAKPCYGCVVCFVKGTLIYSKDGLIEIDRIRSGDLVYSYNLEHQQVELNKVTNILQRETEGIYNLMVAGELIQVTAEHPFFVEGKGWMKVSELQPGNKLKTSTQGSEIIESIKKISGKVTVYNIEVDGNHNYFVTDKKILVHNKSIETENEKPDDQR